MIAGLLFSLIGYFLLVAYASYQAKQQQALIWQDISTPFIVVICWVVLTGIGYGHQSISHFIEIPIALMFLGALYNLKILWLAKRFANRPWLLSLLGVFSVVLLRTFMPYLPE